ncbi:hypothetical protein U9M48_022912 [Paspalum notatum var. saurae]|uniref:NAC domain-containing protein n=1 Tax=Paspalum notatum var. saurae TaxID=547442 RepID=A0AAQ3TJH4_PASNO
MARSWLITGRGIAKKIRYRASSVNHQISELIAEARRECPNCSYVIDNSDVTMEWPGLPAGVKFDPSDLELLEHLEQKIGLGGLKPHVLIDEFIPTIDDDEGICYSHPENLPGTKTDGTISHFFYRASNAYGCGQRKRRRVISCSDDTIPGENVRWHKTGKSKAIYDNGVRKGWKKIMVLYKTSQRGRKADKDHWVMHQYHLGEKEDEKDGEFVVSKIFCQLPNKSKQISEKETAYEEPNASASVIGPKTSEKETAYEEPDAYASVIGPKTPKTNTAKPRHTNDSPCETGQNVSILQDQDEGEPIMPIVSMEDDAVNPAWCAGAQEQQAVGEASRAQPNSDEPLYCREDPNSLNDEAFPLDYPILSQYRNEVLDRNLNTVYGLPDLHDVDLVAPPDLQLCDLQFGSQESFGSWLDRS